MIKDRIKEIAKEMPRDALLRTPKYVGKALEAIVNAVEELETGALLDKALDLIVELVKDDPTDICCELHKIPQENNYCAENCDNFNKSCVLRYLKVKTNVQVESESPARLSKEK